MRQLTASLWLLLFTFYALTGTGHSSFSDGFLVLLTARSLIEEGTFAVEAPAEAGPMSHRKTGVDGRSYIAYGPALAVAHLPALALGRWLPEPSVEGRPVHAFRRDEFYAQLTNAWITATTIVLVLLCGVALGYSPRAALTVATLGAVASPLWTYARIDSTEALQALALIAAFYGVQRGVRDRRSGFVALGGAALGIAVAAKVANGALGAPFLVYCLLRAEPGRRLASASAFLAPLVAMGVLVAWFNLTRFGNPLDTGYDLTVERFDHPFLHGAWTLLFSPSYGLLVFWPAAILLPSGALRLLRRWPHETLLILGIFSANLVLYATWWAYWGLLWGPRFLVPSVPLLLLLCLPLAGSRGALQRGMLAITALAGITVQTITIACGFWTHIAPAQGQLEVSGSQRLIDDPRLSPLRIGAWWLRALLAARTAGEERSRRILATPPWRAAYPWSDEQKAVTELAPIRGVDLWAAPADWRLRTMYVPPPAAQEPIPRSPELAWALLAAVALFTVLTAAGAARVAPTPGVASGPGP